MFHQKSPENTRKIGEKKLLLTHSKSLDTEQLKDISGIYIKNASYRIETITKENVTLYIDGKYYVFLRKEHKMN